MSLRDLFAIHLAASMLFASPVFADDDDDEDDGGPVMQVMIDESTGKKTSQVDDVARPGSASTVVVQDSGRSAAVSAFIGATSEGPTYHADGTVSAKIGLDQMNYLIMTIDESGRKTFSHASTDPAELEKALNAGRAGEE